MDSKKLQISYAGTLMGYVPSKSNISTIGLLKNYFWDYYPKTCFPYTRSGYYFFKGIQQLKEKYPETSREIEVNIWGNIKALNIQQVKEFDIGDIVNISGLVSKSETAIKLAKTDVLFLPLESSLKNQPPLFIPGKLFEYLEYGKPILGLMEDSDAKNILQESNLGIIISPFDTDSIADTLKNLIENKKHLHTLYKPNYSYIKTLSFENTTEKISNVFNELLNNGVNKN